MATIDGYAWTTISDGSIDADSPVDDTLTTDIRDNIENLMRWLGKDYLAGAAANHDHDGTNSAKVAGASGGVGLAVCPYRGPTAGGQLQVDIVRFFPKWMFVIRVYDYSVFAPVTPARPYLKTINMAGTASYEFNQGIITNHGIGALIDGGHLFEPTGAACASTNELYDRLLFGDVSGYIKVGSYTGNGSTQSITAPGFTPDLVMVTATAANQDVVVKSTGLGSNRAATLRGGTIITDGITSLDSNGFTLGANAVANTSSRAYDYLALKAGSFSGERIARLTWAGDNVDGRSITGAGFRPQAALIMRTDNTTNDDRWLQTFNGQKNLARPFSLDTNPDVIHSFDSDGVTVDVNANTSGMNYEAFLFLGGTRYTSIP